MYLEQTGSITNSVGSSPAYICTYDSNGNMTSDSHSVISSMTYDVDNLAISATVNDTQPQYHLDESKIVLRGELLSGPLKPEG